MLRRRDGHLDAPFGGAALAQMHVALVPALHLHQLHDGVVLLADVAQHQGTTSRTSVSVSRPSSSRRVRSALAASERLCVTTTIEISRSRASSANRSWSRSAFT